MLNDYFVFTIENQRYAVTLSAVEKVIRAVELIPLPSPDILLGLINIREKIIPVVNIRKRFCLPVREVDIDDRIIISRVSSRTIAFIVDTVEGVVSFSQDQLDEGGQIFPEMEHYIEGVGKINGDTIIIYNINKLLSARDIEGETKLVTSEHIDF
ncbi:chemotaxis protein CheW [Desulfobacterales bacterium HSG2]|nr:chemotaxis protein CheW [Desulfobacterales bacterium HSG2]